MRLRLRHTHSDKPGEDIVAELGGGSLQVSPNLGLPAVDGGSPRSGPAPGARIPRPVLASLTVPASFVVINVETAPGRISKCRNFLDGKRMTEPY